MNYEANAGIVNDYFRTGSNEYFGDDVILTIQKKDGKETYNYWDASLIIPVMIINEHYALLGEIKDDKVRAAILATYVAYLLTGNESPRVCKDSDVVPYNGGQIADCVYEDIQIKVFCRSQGETTGKFEEFVEWAKKLCQALGRTEDALKELTQMLKEDLNES